MRSKYHSPIFQSLEIIITAIFEKPIASHLSTIAEISECFIHSIGKFKLDLSNLADAIVGLNRIAKCLYLFVGFELKLSLTRYPVAVGKGQFAIVMKS